MSIYADVNDPNTPGPLSVDGTSGADTMTMLTKSSTAAQAGGATGVSNAQYHAYAGAGNDTLVFEFTESHAFTEGHHARGDIPSASGYNAWNQELYADTFNFKDVDNVKDNIVVGRIEDFDESRDTIQVDGVDLDLTDLPSGVRLVRFNGEFDDHSSDPQLWLHIENSNGGHILYALEGARVDMDGTGGSKFTGPKGYEQERHFLHRKDPNTNGNDVGGNNTGAVRDWDAELASLPDAQFIDPMNFVPLWYTEDFDTRPVYNDLDEVKADVDLAINGTNVSEGIAGGLNDDKIYAKGGDDHVWGGSGHDYVHGGGGDDYIEGNSGDDTLIGASGNDTIYGGIGDDTLKGWANDDTLYGEDGDDFITGDNGEDTLGGGQGDDSLYGGLMADVLKGGGGDDLLSGGAGRDEMWGDFVQSDGSDGADIFDFADGDMINHSQTGWDPLLLDVIHDFDINQDTIRFDASTGVTSKDDLRSWVKMIDGDKHFVVKIHRPGEDNHTESILVNVDDNLTWQTFFETSDFFEFG